MIENKKILLTGAAGFIASFTAQKLLADGYEVTGIDNMNDYYDVRLKKYRLKKLRAIPGFSFIKTDIEKLPVLEKLFSKNKFTAVINLAARAGVRASMNNPRIYLSTNTLGTLNILECMKKYQVQKLVLASSSSLYAGQSMPFHEEQPVNSPISPYAATKKAAEMLCRAWHFLYRIDISILRFFTVYGPAGRPDMSIFRFIKWIDEEKPINIYGDGTQSRDFTWVEDVADGVCRALKPLGCEIINIGGGREAGSLLEIIAKIEKILGKKARLNFLPCHAADVKETLADIRKAKNLLGWEPVTGIDTGLFKCADWYLKNKAWCKNIATGE
ncbi:MAG: nucleotide sugar epimerase [Spirochaetes bacterium GWF1_41_5]|nr:MAG: nucleotide sugar epimerase [Spirochaetes bacterium GWF1_41_5]HBE04299.1 nucleotide sugar epimerase [Spirochaetia bacterium]